MGEKTEDNRHYEKVGNEVKDITDELPFEIPDSWEWVRFSNLMHINGGYAFKSENYVNKNDGIRVLRISDFDENGFNSRRPVYHRYNNTLKPFELEINDIIMCMTGGTVGKSFFVNTIPERMLINQRVADIKIIDIVDKIYCYKCLLSDYIQQIINVSKNSTNDNISITLINSFLIPLPPLAEQKRIVAAIEKFEPLIAEYDKLEQEESKLNGEIYDKLKKSILQYAIQGKLVPQDEHDEPASVLLEKIRAEKRAKLGKKYVDSYIYKGDDNCYYEHCNNKAEDTLIETPFDLPSNWTWTKLKYVVTLLTDGTHKTPKYTSLGVPFISVKDLSSGKLNLQNTKFISEQEHNELSKRCNPCLGDILLTKVGTTGIPVLVDTDIKFSLFVSVALIKYNPKNILPQYFIYLLKSPLVQAQAEENTRGVGNKNWVLNDIENTLIPIPPLAEQKRIVDKINEIFANL